MPKNEKKGYKSAYKFLVSYISNHKKWYFIPMMISLVLVGVNLLQVYATKELVNHSIKGIQRETLISVGLFLAITALNAALAWLSKVSTGRLSALCIRDMKKVVANALVNAEYQEVLALQSGDVLNTLNQDTDGVANFISENLVNLFSQLVMALGALAYLLFLDPLLCVITFAYTPLGVLFTMTLNKKLNQLYPKSAEYKGEALSVVEQTLCCIPVIKAFAMERQMLKRIKAAYLNVYRNDRKVSLYNALMQPACYSTSRIPGLTYLAYAGFSVMQGRLSVGTFIAVFSLLDFIIGPSVYLPFLLNGLNRSIASINRIKSIATGLRPQPKGLLTCYEHNPSLRVEKLCFNYTDKRPILEEISFDIKESGIVALKGESGSGKTTLIDLLCGLYAPVRGRVMLCGVDPFKTDASSLISVVSQDVYLFPVSIRENIKLAKLDASEAEVLEASRRAGADGFISMLEEGYDTVIGDGGINLSGGQRQRIAIAQAILKDAPIWILDEPTSALDGETERIVIKTLREASKKKIIVLSAHRQSLLDIADRVINLERQVQIA